MTEEEMILNNIPLIYDVINKMHLYWNTDDEYQQYYDDGMIGLISGVRTFDESKGYKLSTYLYTCISHEISKGIAKKTNSKNNANNNTISLNSTITDEIEQELYEIIPDEKVNVEKEIEQKVQLEAIHKALETLNDKEALMFKMYYGLDGYEPKKQKEIAEEFKITQSYVNRIINKTTYKIREKVKNIERKIIMSEKETSIFKTKEQINPLDEINNILLEQLRRLRNVDFNDKEMSKLEIARSNAISSTSKVILQTIGVQMIVQKKQINLPMIGEK